jgi:integrase
LVPQPVIAHNDSAGRQHEQPEPVQSAPFPSTTKNQYDECAAIGKRFGRLKTRLGYDPGLVFHSIRKTVATLLEDAQCPEGIAADIIGHDKPTMTYGLYSGGSSLATRREWIEKVIRY